MTKSTIKLNHVCKICNKEIYLPDGTIIHGIPLHFSCWKDECRNSRQAEIIEMIDKEIEYRKRLFKNKESESCVHIALKSLKQQIIGKRNDI